MARYKRIGAAVLVMGILGSPALANAAPVSAPKIDVPKQSKASELSFTSAEESAASGDSFWADEKDFTKVATDAADNAKKILEDRDRKAEEAKDRAKAIEDRIARQAEAAGQDNPVTQATDAVNDAVDGAVESIGDASKAAQIVSEAMKQIGKPYVLGATGPDTFDCSGLVQWAANKAGVEVPRVAIDQAAAGQEIEFGDLKPGDLVSYTSGSHIGIYIGQGKVVHAPQPGDVVKISDVDMSEYYKFTRIA